MNNITSDEASTANNDKKEANLSLLNGNAHIQQLLLLALSSAKLQQENTMAETSVQDNDKRKFDQVESQYNSNAYRYSSDHGSPGSDSGSDKLGRPGRKPLSEDEIKMSSMDPKSKRKAQNRAAQRAFRERRVNYVKELEDRIKALEQSQGQTSDKVMEENQKLKKIVQQLQMENAILGGTASSFDFPLSRLTDGNSITAAERPQKLLRSFADDSSGLSSLPASSALFTSADSVSTHDKSSNFGNSSGDNSIIGNSSSSSNNSNINNSINSGYNRNNGESSPEPSLSFATQHSITDCSSPSLSLKSQSFTPPDTTFDDDLLFSSAMPTDILNSFDPSELLSNPFSFDANSINQGLFDSIGGSGAKSASSQNTSQQAGTIRSEDAATNELFDSLLVMDDEDTAKHHLPQSVNDSDAHNTDSGDDGLSLAQVWDKITEHPRFDEFDIDVLCDEMKRKAQCSNKEHNENMKATVEKHYPQH